MICFDIFVERLPALSSCRLGFSELKSRVRNRM